MVLDSYYHCHACVKTKKPLKKIVFIRVSIIIMRCALEMFNEENWHARLAALAKSKPTQFVSITFRPLYWIVCEFLAPRYQRGLLS